MLVFLNGSKAGRVRHTIGVSPFRKRCRGRGNNSVCIGFERWMKHTSRGSGPSVFNGFEGRVRHTLASHSGPFWATSILGLNPAGVSLFRMHRPLHGP